MMRPDAKVESVPLPQARGLSKVYRRPVCPRRIGYQSGGVRPRAFRFSQQAPYKPVARRSAQLSFLTTPPAARRRCRCACSPIITAT